MVVMLAIFVSKFSKEVITCKASLLVDVQATKKHV